MTIGSNVDIGISVLLVVVSIALAVLFFATSEILLGSLWVVILVLNLFTLSVKFKARKRRNTL